MAGTREIRQANPDEVFEIYPGEKTDTDRGLEELKRKVVKFKRGCKVCQNVRKDPRLRKRIHTSKFYNPHSKDSLRQIFADCKLEGRDFSYDSLKNHVKRHDPPINSTLGKALAKEILNTKIQLEKKQLKVEILEKPEELWKQVIKDAKFELESGNIKPTLENALKAAKDYTDFMAKQKDQNMRIASMVWEMSSGQGIDDLSAELEDYTLEINGEKYDGAKITAETSTGDSSVREERPSVVHQRDAGDATASWPSSIPAGNTKKKS